MYTVELLNQTKAVERALNFSDLLGAVATLSDWTDHLSKGWSLVLRQEVED